MELKIIKGVNYTKQENYFELYLIPTIIIYKRNDKHANGISFHFIWLLWYTGINISFKINKKYVFKL